MESEIIIELNKIPPDLLEYFEPIEIDKGTTWRITTKPFKEAHFATYPEALCETPIKAGCPEFVCKKCGKAREKIYEKVGEFQRRWSKNNSDGSPYQKQDSMQNEYKEVGYTDCGCNAGWESGIVLDPFFGAGTTGLVAKNLHRNFIGIELSPEYCKIAEQRLKNTNPLNL